MLEQKTYYHFWTQTQKKEAKSQSVQSKAFSFIYSLSWTLLKMVFAFFRILKMRDPSPYILNGSDLTPLSLSYAWKKVRMKDLTQYKNDSENVFI